MSVGLALILLIIIPIIYIKLYGLLEEARQHAKIIIATSTKLDALESLEKRIKSRFASSGLLHLYLIMTY